MNKSIIFWLFFLILLLVATAVIAITATHRSNPTQLHESVTTQPPQAHEEIVAIQQLQNQNPVATQQPQLEESVETTRQPQLPLRAAFYYAWFPNAWTQQNIYPYTNYTPSLGFYDSGEETIIHNHIEAMQYGKIDAGIISWWGQGHHTDDRIAPILAASSDSGFWWSIYHEGESLGDPTVDEITSDLIYLRDQYSADPSYLKLNGRFVVFVYADANDGCDMVARWTQANTNDINAYLVLKVFSGYQTCSNQPQNWHQYGPDNDADQQKGYSYTISPGFWKKGNTLRLERDLNRWQKNIRDMVSSGTPFQLITTFNEWGEGTSVEAAAEWQSDSGYGLFLDALHNDGKGNFQAHMPFISNDADNINTATPIATATPTPTLTATAMPSSDPVLVGAGDIAECDRQDDEATANLLDSIPGTVFTTGDNAYDYGTAEEFINCYEPSWGRHKDRTRPAVGNHEYRTEGAVPYYAYFGAAAGDPDKGYYSYDLGDWHIIVLNSNCSEVGGCDVDSPQEQWLRQDLAANPAACTLAYMHHPLFSSGKYRVDSSMEDFWQALYDYGADVVIAGHAHNYERFALQDPSGQADPVHGIREFVVGTGGKSHAAIEALLPNSEVTNDDTFGVLQLTLHPASYTWKFIPVPGATFTDSGTAPCK